MEVMSFVDLLDLHIAVDEFYSFHLRRAQRKLQVSCLHESLSRILNKRLVVKFFVVKGQLFSEKNPTF